MVSSVIPGSELKKLPASQLVNRGPLTAAQIEQFFEQGFIVVPSLVPPELLQRMKHAIPQIEKAKFQSNMSLYDTLKFRTWSSNDAYRQVATSSPVAAAAAQLTSAGSQSDDVFIVRDAYFRLKGENIGCGFHVDDPFFWPCPVDAPGPGVNCWIPLHDVDEDGGGLTIAPRSHLADFLDCREAIKDGQTCRLAELDPAKNQRLENIAVSPQMKAGDVLLHTRWMFHRGNPFRSGSKGAQGDGIARYSVRYMPGGTVVNDFDFIDGKFIQKDPIVVNNTTEEDFPAVRL